MAFSNHESAFRDREWLSFARNFTPIVIVIERGTGRSYGLCTYQCMDGWGICNAERTRIIVPERKQYHSAKILANAQLLIAGSFNTGWDIFSLNGNFLKHLPPMSVSEVASTIQKTSNRKSR
ncbi:MAG: hypothetical protein HFJ30_06980 [Clostridia bacterium]|nr:hypothetical protein [Clostridia bacterium]MCI9413436.1 hypothetical protein [Clostridia bacterium]